MKLFIGYKPLLRAVGVVSTVGILVSSVTYAALQSQQATLTGNTIQSATADLRIGTSATSFSASRAGFSFTDIAPGGAAMPVDGNIFYLKDYSAVPLNIHMMVAGTLTNVAGTDLSKVVVHITRVDTNVTQTATLQSLIDGYATNTGLTLTDPIAGTTVAQYKLRVSMLAGAFTGTSASLGGIDFVFAGVTD